MDTKRDIYTLCYIKHTTPWIFPPLNFDLSTSCGGGYTHGGYHVTWAFHRRTVLHHPTRCCSWGMPIHHLYRSVKCQLFGFLALWLCTCRGTTPFFALFFHSSKDSPCSQQQDQGTKGWDPEREDASPVRRQHTPRKDNFTGNLSPKDWIIMYDKACKVVLQLWRFYSICCDHFDGLSLP